MKATMLAIASLCLLASCHPTSGTLKGIAYSSGQPVPGVKINLIAKDQKLFTTVSGQDGSYQIKDLPLGKYLYVAQYGDKPVSADQQLNVLVKHNNEIKQYLGQDISDDQIRQLKLESERSIGLDAMRYYQQMQQSSNEMISSFAKKTGVEWDKTPEHMNKMISVDEVEIKGDQQKDLKL